MKKENLILVAQAMNYPEVINLVSEASDRIWHKITDVTTFEHTCYRNIGEAIRNNPVKSIGGLATYIIRRAEAWHVKHRGRAPVESIESLAGFDDEGSLVVYEIEDVLANVERKVIGNIRHKEIATFLAEGDDLKTEILNAWTNGYTNDSELSRVLANSFDRNSSGIRREIQRFKDVCKKRLAAA